MRKNTEFGSRAGDFPAPEPPKPDGPTTKWGDKVADGELADGFQAAPAAEDAPPEEASQEAAPADDQTAGPTDEVIPDGNPVDREVETISQGDVGSAEELLGLIPNPEAEGDA